MFEWTQVQPTPESRDFYQVRGAGASVQRLVNAVREVLIPRVDIRKK